MTMTRTLSPSKRSVWLGNAGWPNSPGRAPGPELPAWPRTDWPRLRPGPLPLPRAPGKRWACHRNPVAGGQGLGGRQGNRLQQHHRRDHQRGAEALLTCEGLEVLSVLSDGRLDIAGDVVDGQA